jgi:hypothetical protein
MTLDELIAGEQETALARTRAEMAAEKAAWEAIPQAERDRQTAAMEAKYGAAQEAVEEIECQSCGELADDCECEEGPDV